MIALEEGRLAEIPVQDLCLEVVHWIASQPEIRAEFKGLFIHNQNSALHTMRVALGMISASLELGLDAQLAGLCGILHDIGKQDVNQEDMALKDPDAKAIERIRELHMFGTRTRIKKLPLSDPYRQQILAVTMAHHERLSGPNGRGPYPRKKDSPHVDAVDRYVPDEKSRNMQILLAMCDHVDRFTSGFNSSEKNPVEEVRKRLDDILIDSTQPVDEQIGLQFAGTVTRCFQEIPQDMVDQAMLILFN